MGSALVSDPVRGGFEPAAMHEPLGAAVTSVNVNRRRKRRASHGGDALGGTTSVGAQVEPSGAADFGGGRPGPVQRRNYLATGSSRIEPRRHAGRFGRVIRHTLVVVFGPTPDPVSATRAESGA